MARHRTPHVWAVEGAWSRSVRDVRTVQPVLESLEAAGVAGHARQFVNDRDDVVTALRRWGQAQHDRFTIGYLALHGSPGTVYANGKPVDLFAVAAELPAGLLAEKVLHVGSCAVLRMPEPDQRALRSALGVKVLCGFTRDVDWFPALAFELLLFDALTGYARPGNAYRHLRGTYPDLADRLGFVMLT